MSFNPNSMESLVALREPLRRARMGTPRDLGDLIVEVYSVMGSQVPAAKGRVCDLVESGAFTDAALALLELGIPHWELRRLIYDSGEWHCSLSACASRSSSMTWPRQVMRFCPWQS